LGLLSLHELGAGWWRWWALDVVWAVAGGLAIGYVLGTLVGRAVLYLRIRHREALGADEFIAFGLIALAYGMALSCHTYGFLAVFAAGLALRRIDDRSSADAIKAQSLNSAAETSTDAADAARHADAPGNMMQAVQRFNSQLERFAEVGIVLTVGTELFLIIRPLAVYVGLVGTKVTGRARALMGWFGIRGIGSVYYLMYAISHDIQPALAKQLLSITIAVVVASIVAHGVSVTPLMTWYGKRRSYWRKSAHPP
jgi:NhaP-type Na+/H+ or K+/H+ antiporter